jgi:nitric oxide reductase activation protein
MTSGTTGAPPGVATGATCTKAEGPAGEDAWVDGVRRRHAHLIRSIRRRFEALRGEDKAERRQLDGEEIDLDAQVEARADRAAAANPRRACSSTAARSNVRWR